MTNDVSVPGGSWSRQEESPAEDSASISAVRDRLIEACLPQASCSGNHRPLSELVVPEAVLVLLGDRTHRTEAVEELSAPSIGEFVRAVILTTADALRSGRTDINGGLARIWCAPAEADDAGAVPLARVQSIHLAKAGPSWKVTAIVATAPED